MKERNQTGGDNHPPGFILPHADLWGGGVPEVWKSSATQSTKERTSGLESQQGHRSHPGGFCGRLSKEAWRKMGQSEWQQNT